MFQQLWCVYNRFDAWDRTTHTLETIQLEGTHPPCPAAATDELEHGILQVQIN